MAGTTIAGLPSESELLYLPALPVAGLILLLGLKLGALFLFGPTMTPDSAGYIDYADQILTGDFLHVDLDASAFPMTSARPIGYPAVIALAKIVAGARWAWAVVLFRSWSTAWRGGSGFGLGPVSALPRRKPPRCSLFSTRRFYPTACVQLRRRQRLVF